MAGEVGWLSCPLISNSSVHNSTESTGHTPAWYRLLPGHHLGQPIKHRYDRRKSQPLCRFFTVMCDAGGGGPSADWLMCRAVIGCSQRLSRDGDRLWLQPANAADAGVYICELR